MNKSLYILVVLGIIISTISSCKKKDKKSIDDNTTVVNTDTTVTINNDDANNNNCDYQTSLYEINIPEGWPTLDSILLSPLSVEGIKLGRYLYYDPIVSIDSNISCASCHIQIHAFSSPANTLGNVKGIATPRNVMAIINLVWTENLTWDGRSAGLLKKVHGSYANPFGMNGEQEVVLNRLKKDTSYANQFERIYGSNQITHENAIDAIRQFITTLISSDSKYDRYLRQEENLSEAEFAGMELFFTEKGDCFHCHGTKLLTNNDFHNNGLDSTFTDIGRGNITDYAYDDGKFRATTLRNIEYTGPYMHDGRFETLEEVIDFYSDSLVVSETIDPLMKKIHQGGVQLSIEEKANLKAFLLTFSDTSFIHQTSFSTPFK